jgi:hypothetical protein
MAPKSTKTRMTEAHKAALAEGRNQGRAVKRYLEALEANKPKRGRKRTPESIRKRLDRIAETLEDASAVERLQLAQERMDLESELEAREAKIDLAALENDFVKVAKDYGARKGISYAAWREVGVEAAVLKRAGVSRGRT